jgi:hypothetical protein
MVQHHINKKMCSVVIILFNPVYAIFFIRWNTIGFPEYISKF